MDEEAVRTVERQELTKLLNGDSAVGCAVTLVCRIRREPTSMVTTTYRIRKLAVTEMKKSQATMALA